MKIEKSYIVFAFIVLSVFLSCENKSRIVPNSESLLSSFGLADGFQIELIASEPLISDPVDMEIDENGKMYVVEMHGYPLDKSGSGKVKVLRDINGDGRMDHSEVFADNLKFPTGVLRWKQGILVTDPPNVLYFEDTDEDGKADIRDTLISGFALSNPQHNFNNPILGIDNWIYISNEPAIKAKVYTEEFSDPGSEIRFHDAKNNTVLPVNASGRRMRMRPDQQQLEVTSSRSQFGHTTDQWGHHFLTSNANHIFQEVIQSAYLDRNPQLLLSNATEVISNHGAAAEVFPITEDPEFQLLTDLGVFTSACGITAYSGGVFPKEFENAVFVAEPVGNIVHVDIVDESGISFNASRKYENKEFLASKDAWFRPVNHYVGPDGALYVVDYYRRIIEHPEWMAEEVINSGKLFDGIDKGRIYRITPKGTKSAKWPSEMKLGSLSNDELITFLNHDNSWYRQNVQRLLIDRGSPSIVPDLEQIIESGKSSFGRLHAAWTLEGLGTLRPESIIELMKDPEAGVRENAIILSEDYLSNKEILDALTALENDPNIRVRFQLLCSLGEVDLPEVNAVRQRMVIENISEKWMQIAALTAENPQLSALLDVSIANFVEDENAYNQFIKNIVSVISANKEIKEIQKLISQSLTPSGKEDDNWRAAILQGINSGSKNIDFSSKGLDKERNLLINGVFTDPSEEVRSASLLLLENIGLPKNKISADAVLRSFEAIRKKNSPQNDRERAIGYLALANHKSSYQLLEGLLVPEENTRIQQAALKSMYKLKGTEFIRYLIKKWPSMTPGLRDEAVKIMLSAEEGRRILINALENQLVDPSAIKWPQRVGMMAQANDELRKRARMIFSDGTTDDEKQALLDEYQEVKDIEGNAKRGLKVFELNCALCHQIGGEFGTAFGPDLASIRNRKSEAIVKDILDPGLSIADGYELWEVTLKNGEVKQGIISSETGNSITLRVLGNEDEVIGRENIERLESRNISVMPTGLENQIDVQAMSDLLTFIKQLN